MAKDKKGQKESSQEQKAPDQARHSAKERPRLRSRFEKEVAPALLKELELKNVMAVPRLHKIVVNMGVGEATQNAKVLDPAVNELGADHRTEAGGDAGQEIDCGVQSAPGAIDWRDGDAARRPHVRIFRPAGEHRSAARARLSRRVDQVVRWPGQLHAGPARPVDLSRRFLTRRSTSRRA